MLRATLKSLLARKLRLLMSATAVVLGVAFVSGSLIFSDTLERGFTALFASTVGDVVVTPEGGRTPDGQLSTATVPAGVVDRLAQLPGAARADGSVGATGVFVVGTNGKVVGGFGPPALATSWSDAPAGHGLTGFAIVEGRPPSGADEVVLDSRTLERAGHELGDRVRIVTGTDELSVEPLIVGVGAFPEGGSLAGATLVVFDVPTAQQLFLEGADAFNEVWITARDGVGQEELRDQAAAALEGEKYDVVTGDQAADDSASDLLEAVSFLSTFLLVFAGIALVVGSFLIVNTFSILVAQRARELALLRALGASRTQLVGSVQLEALILGVVGSTVGLGLGVALAAAIRAVFSTFGLDVTNSLVFAPSTVVAAYVVGVLVTAVAGLIPAWRTSRVVPMQVLAATPSLPRSSLRTRALVGVVLVAVGVVALAIGLADWLPRPVWWVGLGVLATLLGFATASPILSRPYLLAARKVSARIFGAVGNLAGENALRQPVRTAATASALMIGLALVSSMATLGSSAEASVDKAVSESFVGDYAVNNVYGAPFSPDIGEQIADVDGVDAVVRERYAYVRFDGEDQGIAAVDGSSAARLRLDAVEGSFADFGHGTVVLQQRFARDHDLGVGDPMTFELPVGERTWPVAAVMADNPLITFPIMTDLQTLGAAGFPRRDNVLFVWESPGAVGVQERLDDLVVDLPVVTVKDEREFAAEQRAPVDQLLTMIYALLGLALVIAILGIVNTLALSVIERTREVGLLRALGLTRAQLRRMVTVESVVIALLGALLGLALGTAFGVVLVRALEDQGLEALRVPFVQLALFLVLAVIVGVLAAVVPARRAARLDVLGAIATE